ncbi:hypothetical protein JCM3766R1_000628 [Sporobolomyces carnicolor]
MTDSSTSNPAARVEPEPASVAARARAARRRVPFFANAAQPEIVRANQKDLYYLAQLSQQIEDVARSLLGTRWLQKWSKELHHGSRLAYFGLTTLLGSQTLGEEYCDILQYQTRNRKPPSHARRAALVSLHVVVPYLLARLYSDARRALVARQEALKASSSADVDSLFVTSPPPPPPRKGSIVATTLDRLSSFANDLPLFETLTEDYLRSVHLTVFYLFGRYYNLSKRLTGIRFISMQGRRASNPANSPAPSSYEVLGVLMAVQFLTRAILAYRRRRQAAALADPDYLEKQDAKKRNDGDEGNDKRTKRRPFLVDGKPLSAVVFDPDDPEQSAPYPDAEDSERSCTLCLGTRRDSTATECGHTMGFVLDDEKVCWECVVGWAREKSECPLCRQRISLSTLLPLQNL